MTRVYTNFGTRESARKLRVEPTVNIGGTIFQTNIQKALEYLDGLIAATPPTLTGLVDFISGFTFSNDATTPNTVFDLSAGSCVSDDGTTFMTLPACTKTISSWVAGSGNGSLDTGSAANGWYHGFIIHNPTSLVTDPLISTSAASPTMPSGYTKKRRAFAVFIDPSIHILAITVLGDEYLFAEPVSAGIAGGSLGTTPVLATLAVPTGIRVIARMSGFMNHASTLCGILVNSPDANANAVNSPAGNVTTLNQVVGRDICFEKEVRTNTSGQGRFVSSTANTVVTVATRGFLLPR